MAVDTTEEYFFLFMIWLISTVVIHLIFKKSTKSNPPPGPQPLPIIGNLHQVTSQLPKSLQKLSNRYGPLMQLYMGNTRFVIVSDANTAEQVLKAHDVDFASKYEPGPAQKLLYKGCAFINGPYSTYWRFMKKICVTKMFTSLQLQRFTRVREEERIKLLKSLIKRSEAGEPCDLSKEIEALTSFMIYRMLLGNRSWVGVGDCSSEALEIRGLVRNVIECGMRYSVLEVYGPIRRFDLFGNGKRIELAFSKFDEKFEKIMNEYEVNRIGCVCQDDEKDVMDILLETYRDPDAEVKITKSHIKYFFMEILMASVDTTSATMQSTMLELLNRPKTMKKLTDEINSTVTNHLVNESDISNLPYLQAVVKETLRLHPPGPLLRRSPMVDKKINGYDIKSGTKMFVNCYAIMRDPKAWDQPDEFIPERFLNDNRSIDFKGQDFRYLPFGSGRRACLGVSHSLYVMHATLAALIQCFDWKINGGDEKAGVNVATGYAGAMASSLVCCPVVRFNPFD